MDVAERGVTLRFLLQLVQAGAVDESWTIQQVVDRFVRPMTEASKCCLHDVIPDGPGCSGHPQYFVSQAWSNKMSNLLQLLKTHFKVDSPSDAAAGVVLWLDIVAVNQHPHAGKGCLPPDDVVKLVRTTERTLLCLDTDCMALTRIWCLYEVWQTLLAKGAAGLLLLLPAAAKPRRLATVLGALNVNKADASLAADKDRILAVLLEQVAGIPGGAANVNVQLKRALLESTRQEAAAGPAPPEGEDLAEQVSKTGVVLMANGQHAEAEPLFRQALEIRTRLLGPEHPITLASIRNLGSCIDDQGRSAEAEPLYRQAVEGKTRVLGPDHPDTLAGIYNLAACIDDQGRGEEAEPLYRQALEGKTRVLGPDHPNTLANLNSLAACIDGHGRRSEAELLYRRALEGMTRVLGPSHPDTLTAIYHMANCINAQGRSSEAEPLYRKALEGRTRVLGPDHPDTTVLLYCLCNANTEGGGEGEGWDSGGYTI